MKKYIGFLLCVSAALFAASCGEKQSLEVDNTPKLRVVSHDVVFQPDGGTGSITVECESAITAEVQTTNSAGEKWCTATVDGKKINVTVGKYSGVESRYSNIIIKGADETLNVAVHQYGIIMNEFDADDAIIKNPAQTLS
ncbi:MAG: BACON domain-containing protein, partial [Bacteroidales bacterium]|nr:BACON domain-containing protein [Bacteroidales bacterium]